MSFLDDVREDRQPLALVLKKHRGIRRIVEDLYPDRAHFIYELLQNAEDKGATKAEFALDQHSVRFEHNGESFSESDVWGITDIGEGAKAGQEDKIGRFGVGFKAIFAYCETPRISSPTFSFAITDLVLPSAIDPKQGADGMTCFGFEFNNPKKAPSVAYAEVKAGLDELAETTLLFLSHLESISWQIDDCEPCAVQRVRHSDNHYEVLKKSGDTITASSHFLKFDQAIDGLANQRVAIAFALNLLPNVVEFAPSVPFANQMRIGAANPGRVAVFFPAEKEVSGLRFHLHAPFVPELSRASIKETPANQPLFEQIALLASRALHNIRDTGLLTLEFLSVLPNKQDQIPERYDIIRSAIIQEMNSQPLTPTYARSYAPAKQLMQAKASLKDLLSVGDIEVLLGAGGAREWAIAATQKNTNADRFLASLGIIQWDIEEFVRYLRDKAAVRARVVSSSPFQVVNGPDLQFVAWLSAKSMDWHQKFYSLLYAEFSPSGTWKRLKDLKIVRLSDGSYSSGGECFFPGENTDNDGALPLVDSGIYTSGRSQVQQENARKCLKELGVRVVGESEQVEALLKQRYKSENFRPRKQDLRRFIGLVEKEPSKATLFGEYYIFEGSDGKWRTPNRIFLDSPFRDTGLAAYFDALGDKSQCVALANTYVDYGVAVKRLGKFAEAVGAQVSLRIVPASCSSNPEWPHLSSVSGDRYTSPIDQDFVILGLEDILSSPSSAISSLVWSKMISMGHQQGHLRAQYQKSDRWGAHYADSQLVHVLRTAAWVPQASGAFVKPAEASRELLPEGFAFDQGWPWLKAIRFGEQERRRTEEEQKIQTTASALGFADRHTLERAQQFAALPIDEQERILADFQSRKQIELPEHEPRNPVLRAERVAQQASAAPRKTSEERTRSVSVGIDNVKQQASEYLREQYTNDAEMICQICQAPLPFKMDDGNYYFEKVEFLEELGNRYYQNYLALCPNHSAMFQHANGARSLLKDKFNALATQRLGILLAQQELTLYFTKTHIADLKQVVKIDDARPESSESQG
jgi:hypothetical protein